MATSEFRQRFVRVMAAILGSFMLLGGLGFLLAVLTDTLPGRTLVNAVGGFLFGWLLLSHGLGWHTPLRRSPPSP